MALENIMTKDWRVHTVLGQNCILLSLPHESNMFLILNGICDNELFNQMTTQHVPKAILIYFSSWGCYLVKLVVVYSL
jgi:hypothetical protein